MSLRATPNPGYDAPAVSAEQVGVQPSPRDPLEIAACTPHPLDRRNLNGRAKIPHGLTSRHVFAAMQEYIDFLGFINGQLATRDISRFETMLMPANFSSMVGEFMSASIPKHCPTIAKNNFHNGHPDLVPKGVFAGDSILHGNQGIEIKASRYLKGWQGHNPEDVWLMVFVFDSNRPVDPGKGVAPKPFRFLMVCGALLEKGDWSFAGREGESRRTITATVLPSGYEKMRKNWIYLDPSQR
jgi:hypothetical protein